MTRWELSKTGTPIVRCHAETAQWEQWLLWISDAHWDSKYCNRDMMKRHLDLAVKRNAMIFDIGDHFDAMQGRSDKRGNKSSLRDEHKVSDYYQTLIHTAAEWLMPYKRNIVMMSPGNHETSVLQKAEVDLTKGLVNALNASGGQIIQGRYAGYISFLTTIHGGDRPKTRRLNVYYTHGHGGGGPVTKGTIQAHRRATFITDADLVVTGHIHEMYRVPYVQHRINIRGREYKATQWHICIPGYKDEYRIGALDGWHIETGKPPKPVGAWWTRMWLERDRDYGADGYALRYHLQFME